MPRSRSPCAVALGLALFGLTTPLAAQRSTDDVFRAFLATPAAASTAMVLEPVQEGRLTSDDGSATASAVATAPSGWLVDNGVYVLGGVAALGTGLMLNQPSRGAAASLAATNAPPAVNKPPVAPAAAPTTGPAASPTTIVNPEPGTVLLLATGLVGLGLLARRRHLRA